MASRKAVGSLIGIGFLLMIIAVATSYLQLQQGIERRSTAIIQDMSMFDKDSADEDLTIQYIELTVGNSFNLTVKNTGTVFSELEWIYVYDVDDNKIHYYRLDTALNPLDTRKNVGNATIVVNPVHTYIVKIITRLGNIYNSEYPVPTDGGGGDTGNTIETQFYYVDSASDTYSPTAEGMNSLFNAMKAGPDHINNTLTEEEIVIAPTSIDLIDAESFEGSWPPTDWTYTGDWNKESDEVYDGSYSADFDGQGSGTSGLLYTPVMDCSDADSITVDFWFYDDDLDGNEMSLYYYDGSNWDFIETLSTVYTENQWHNYQDTITDSQYLISNFQITFYAYDVENNEHGYVDLITVFKETSGGSYYDMDLEATWTGLPSTTYKYLTIYAGIQDAEALRVDYWDGDSWENLITDVTAGYNLVDVSGVLSGSSFTIRFTDTDDTGDNTENSWDIDAVYLNLFD